MPYIDAVGQRLLRVVPGLARVEGWLTTLGRAILPASLVLLIGSGVLLQAGLTSAEGLRADTLRALHGWGAVALGALLTYRGFCAAVAWLWRRLTGRPTSRAWRRLPPSTAADWVRAGWWLCLGLLGVSGVARWAISAWGWNPPAFGDPAVWGVIHAVTVPYAYGFGLLLLYLRLREALPSLRAYLVRHY